MENKINVAQLLKDCPKGMELDCTIFDDVVFEKVDSESNDSWIVLKRLKSNATFFVSRYGQYYNTKDAKCVIFPKGKTTWGGFIPLYKFKDGDVIFKRNFIAIIHLIEEEGKIWYHCWFNTKYENYKLKKDYGIGNINDGDEVRLATEEEKAKLFKVIKENGYTWNAEKKALEKLMIEPKFKVGNKIKEINSNEGVVLITDITDDYYIVETEYCMKVAISMNMQNNYELVPNKFDISTLKPFESRVLVRDRNNDEWRGQFFSHYNNCSDRPYICIGIERLFEYKQCIPYEGNEHLLGTTDDCNEFYKTWE